MKSRTEAQGLDVVVEVWSRSKGMEGETRNLSYS